MTLRRVPRWLPWSTPEERTLARHDRAARALVEAASAGDRRRVERMLHPDVELTVDGGGVVAGPGSALRGASEVGAHLASTLLDPQTTLRVESVNGFPGVTVRRSRRVTGVLAIRVQAGLIVEAWLIVNPEKLSAWAS